MCIKFGHSEPLQKKVMAQNVKNFKIYSLSVEHCTQLQAQVTGLESIQRMHTLCEEVKHHIISEIWKISEHTSQSMHVCRYVAM